MSPSTNTQSVPKTSTTTLALLPSTSSYVAQTSLNNTINDLFEKLNGKFDKQDEKLESIIASQDGKIDKKFEEELQLLSIHITEISFKYSEQAKLFPSYENHLDEISNNKKISTRFDTARKENEEYSKMKFDKFKTEVYSFINMK